MESIQLDPAIVEAIVNRHLPHLQGIPLTYKTLMEWVVVLKDNSKRLKFANLQEFMKFCANNLSMGSICANVYVCAIWYPNKVYRYDELIAYAKNHIYTPLIRIDRL